MKPMLLMWISLASLNAFAGGGFKCTSVSKSKTESCVAKESQACREALLQERMGFGRKATGGSEGEFYAVTSLQDEASPGTLRHAVQSVGPRWIYFKVSGTIHLKGSLKLRSNQTVDGRGARITITGNPISLTSGQENIIINDLTFDGSAGDSINILDDAKKIWIHHNDFNRSGDGLLDAKDAVTDITISGNRFGEQKDRTMLLAADKGSGGKITVTANHFDGGYSRLPKVGGFKVHIHNNFYNQTDGRNDVTCKSDCEVYAEGNFYYPKKSGENVMVTEIGDDGVRGKLRAVNNSLQKGAKIEEHDPSHVFRPADEYSYNTRTPNKDLACAVMNFSGPRP